MSTFLVSYSIHASSEFQNALNHGMQKVFERKSYCMKLDKTLWYVVKDTTSEKLRKWIGEKFKELNKEVNDRKAYISISVNEVIDWSMLNEREVATWLNMVAY